MLSYAHRNGKGIYSQALDEVVEEVSNAKWRDPIERNANIALMDLHKASNYYEKESPTPNKRSRNYNIE